MPSKQLTLHILINIYHTTAQRDLKYLACESRRISGSRFRPNEKAIFWDGEKRRVFIAEWSLTHGHSEFVVLKDSINTKNISNSERVYRISLSHDPDWSSSGVQFEHPVPTRAFLILVLRERGEVCLSVFIFWSRGWTFDWGKHLYEELQHQ